MNEKKYPKLPANCDHPINRREYLPTRDAPKLVTCLDCGAILLMVVGGSVAAVPTKVPLAARFFEEQKQ